MRALHGLLAALVAGIGVPAWAATPPVDEPAQAPPAEEAVATPEPAPAPAMTLELHRLLLAADELAGRGNPSTASYAYEAAVSHPDFAHLGAPARGTYLLAATRLAVDAGSLPRAHRLAQAAAEADPDSPDAWFLLGQLAASQDRHEEAARAFTRLVRDWPDTAGHLEAHAINPVLSRLGLDSQANADLLEALYAADWTVDGIEPGHAWARLALARAGRGDVDGAREVLARVQAPAMVVWFRSDRRFDALVDRDDPRLDPARAAEAEIARLRDLAAASPDALAPLVELGYTLLMAGRADEALALADDAIADPTRFADSGDLAWMHNHRAVALRRLDRTDEALAALTAAAAVTEDGLPNVSQALNLGTLLADLERPEEALAAVGRLENLSGYGLMVQSSVRMRAFRQLGLERDAAVWTARLHEGRDDARLLWLGALLWAGDLDAAADWLAGLLADPDHRAEALGWSQHYLAPPPLPGRARLVEARRALLARADVQAAISTVGRITSPGLYDTVGID